MQTHKALVEPNLWPSTVRTGSYDRKHGFRGVTEKQARESQFSTLNGPCCAPGAFATLLFVTYSLLLPAPAPAATPTQVVSFNVHYTCEVDFSHDTAPGQQNNQFTMPSVPVRLEATLQYQDALGFDYPVTGERVAFQVNYGNGWTNLPDDGMSFTSRRTDNNGFASIYYLPPEDIVSSSAPLDFSTNIQVQAVFLGNSSYAGSTSSVSSLVVTNVNTGGMRLIHPATQPNSIPLILVHGDGSDGHFIPEWTPIDPYITPWEPDTACRWGMFLSYVAAHSQDFERFDIYLWRHPSARPIGFNGTTGNAKDFARDFYAQGFGNLPIRPIILAHSRGGLVVRSFMNAYRNGHPQGDDIAGLITLDTPHHGSPVAIPDWAALIWRQYVGNYVDAFNNLVCPDQGTLFWGTVPSGVGGFLDTDRIGTISLAWDNMDGAVTGGDCISDFNVIIATAQQCCLTTRDVNGADDRESDPTIWLPQTYKTAFGTLAQLNINQAASGQFLKIVTFGAYDEDLADNGNPASMGDLITWALISERNDEHGALKYFTLLLANASEALTNRGLGYWANDGMVPVQSSLLLDISDGAAYSSVNGTSPQADETLIDASAKRQGTKGYWLFRGDRIMHNAVTVTPSPNYLPIRDHLDVLDTPISNSDYWQAIKSEILGFVDGSPSPPIANAATAITSSGFTANWSSSIGATAYRLDVSSSSSFSTLLPNYEDLDVGDATNEPVTGLVAGMSYYYRVRAYNANGPSANSDAIPVTTVPSAPTANPPTAITGSGFTANWSTAVGATGYQLDVSTSGSFAGFVNAYQDADVGDVTSVSVSGLPGGTAYFYRVRAYDSGGTSDNSSAISVSIPAGGLVAYYPLDGNVLDASGHLFDGEIHGTVSYVPDRQGRPAAALGLQAEGDYVVLPVFAGYDFSSASLSAWFCPMAPESPAGVCMVMTLFGRDTIPWVASSFYVYQGDIGCGFGLDDNTSVISQGFAGASIGYWHHGVQTYDGSTGTLYLDGIMVSRVEIGRALALGPYNSFIGLDRQVGGPSIGGQNFIGYLDDVRFYNRALSATEVQALYQLSVPTLAITKAVDGQFQISVAGSLGQTFDVQTSIDLMNWTHLTTVTLTGGTAQVTDQELQLNHRFYRAVLVP
jgi:hypothetical protein